MSSLVNDPEDSFDDDSVEHEVGKSSRRSQRPQKQHAVGSSSVNANQVEVELSQSQKEAMIRMKKIVEQFIERNDSGPFREPVDWRALELYDYPKIVKRMMDLGTINKKLNRNEYTCAAEVAYDIRQIWKNCMAYNAENSQFYLLAKSFSKRFEDRYRRIRNEFDVGVEPVFEEEEEESEEKQFPQNDEDNDDDEDDDENDDAEDDYENHTRRGSRSASSGATGSSGRKSVKRQRSRSKEIDDDETPNDEDEYEEDNEMDVYDEDEIVDDERSPSNKRCRVKASTNVKLDVKAKFASNLFLLSGVELGFVISKLERTCPQALEQGPKMAVPEQLEINIDAIDSETFTALNEYAAEKVAQRKQNRQFGVPTTTPPATQSSSGIISTTLSETYSNKSDDNPSPDVAQQNSGGAKKKRKR